MELPPAAPAPPIQRPGFAFLALLELAAMVALFLVALLLLAGIGLLSALLANIPVVAAALIMAKDFEGEQALKLSRRPVGRPGPPACRRCK